MFRQVVLKIEHSPHISRRVESCSLRMSELEWIHVASKSLGYCAHLLQKIKQLKERLAALQEEVTRLQSLVQEHNEEHGYDTVH